jgi:hypothetical protein
MFALCSSNSYLPGLRLPGLFLLVALLGLLPLSVSAQSLAQAQSPAPPSGGTVMDGLDPARLAVIGAGVVLGAMAMEVLIVGDLAILAGAVTGGVLTDWWYRTQDRPTLLPKAAYRAAIQAGQPGTAPGTATAIRLAMLPRR